MKGEHADIYIKDDGQGIKPELLKNVFDRFFHNSENNNGGSGLGLSIAKTIIELHDCELTLTTDSLGTCISIELPL